MGRFKTVPLSDLGHKHRALETLGSTTEYILGQNRYHVKEYYPFGPIDADLLRILTNLPASQSSCHSLAYETVQDGYRYYLALSPDGADFDAVSCSPPLPELSSRLHKTIVDGLSAIADCSELATRTLLAAILCARLLLASHGPELLTTASWQLVCLYTAHMLCSEEDEDELSGTMSVLEFWTKAGFDYKLFHSLITLLGLYPILDERVLHEDDPEQALEDMRRGC